MIDDTSFREDARPDPSSPTDRLATDGCPTVVLHVEPDDRAAELLAAFATQFAEGVRVSSVGRLDDALDAVETGVEVDGETAAVDCVVTEQRLLAGGGVDLVERLRAAGNDLPVVFHTTCPSEEAEARAFGAGADAYFEKRADADRYGAVLDRIRTLVEARHGRDERSEPGAALSAGATDSAGGTLSSEE